MISEKENMRISKFLSLVLRHKPETINFTLDENGWTDAAILIGQMNANGFTVSKEILQHIVNTNTKSRFAFNDDQTKIRANQVILLRWSLAMSPGNHLQFYFMALQNPA